MISQNATFAGVAPVDPGESHPPGLGVVRALRPVLNGHEWITGEPDNWRDCGWSMPCARGGGALELVVTQRGADGEWMLQIAPARIPGLLGRVLGRAPSAGPEDCHALAVDTHAVLAARFTKVRWRWDGYPDEEHSTPAPAAPPA